MHSLLWFPPPFFFSRCGANWLANNPMADSTTLSIITNLLYCYKKIKIKRKQQCYVFVKMLQSFITAQWEFQMYKEREKVTSYKTQVTYTLLFFFFMSFYENSFVQLSISFLKNKRVDHIYSFITFKFKIHTHSFLKLDLCHWIYFWYT